MMTSMLRFAASIAAASRDRMTSSAPEFAGGGELGLRRGEDLDFGAHGLGQLDGHVAQPAQADDADDVALLDVEVAQRRVGGDAGAQQRRGGGGVEAVRDVKDVAAVHHDGGGVAALGGGVAVAAVLRAVGPGHAVFAVLFQAVEAAVAFTAGIDQAADADTLAGGEIVDGGTDPADAAHDFVAGDQRVVLGAPLSARGVDVRVAEPAEFDVDLDVVFLRRPARNRQGNQAAVRAVAP